VIAQWQNILYDEYLPLILGSTAMREYNLELGPKDTYSTYNPKINATISHAFATAAYRFGHTLINGVIHLIKRLQPVGSYKLRDNYFDASQVCSTLHNKHTSNRCTSVLYFDIVDNAKQWRWLQFNSRRISNAKCTSL